MSTITLEHKAQTRWEHEWGGFVVTPPVTSAEESKVLSDNMEALGYYYDSDWCTDDCPRCNAGFTDPGTAITLEV